MLYIVRVFNFSDKNSTLSVGCVFLSVLLLHAFIFVVEAIVGTVGKVSRQIASVLVLVQIDGTDMGVHIFVIIIVYAGLTV